MSYNFTKLAEVEALNEVPENATVLAEVDGSVKRIPGSGLGGGSASAKIIDARVWYDQNDDGDSVPFCRFGELPSDFFTPYLNGEFPPVIARVHVSGEGTAGNCYYCSVNSIPVYRTDDGEIMGAPSPVAVSVLIALNGGVYLMKTTYTYNGKEDFFECDESNIMYLF